MFFKTRIGFNPPSWMLRESSGISFSPLLQVLRETFSDLGLTYSIGGQISFDVFPKVWVWATDMIFGV